MRASVAGLLAACALIGIPRLASELREYRRESRQPLPPVTSVPPENRPAASAAPVPKGADAAALPKPAPMQLVSMQPELSPPAGAGAKPLAAASPANEAELIPAIQKELNRLGYYDGPITDKWSRAVRSAVREFLRKTGSRVRHPQPTAGLLAALKAAEPVKKQAASQPEAPRPEKKPALINGPSVKETPQKQNTATLEATVRWPEGIEETPSKQAAATPMPAAPNDDYLPPWMTAKTDHPHFASKSETGRPDEPVEVRRPELAEASSSFDDASKRRFHRRKGRRHYVSQHGYYSHRRAFLFPF